MLFLLKSCQVQKRRRDEKGREGRRKKRREEKSEEEMREKRRKRVQMSCEEEN